MKTVLVFQLLAALLGLLVTVGCETAPREPYAGSYHYHVQDSPQMAFANLQRSLNTTVVLQVELYNIEDAGNAYDKLYDVEITKVEQVSVHEVGFSVSGQQPILKGVDRGGPGLAWEITGYKRASLSMNWNNIYAFKTHGGIIDAIGEGLIGTGRGVGQYVSLDTPPGEIRIYFRDGNSRDRFVTALDLFLSHHAAR